MRKAKCRAGNNKLGQECLMKRDTDAECKRIARERPAMYWLREPRENIEHPTSITQHPEPGENEKIGSSIFGCWEFQALNSWNGRGRLVPAGRN